MNFRRVNAGKVADIAANVAVLLAGVELSGIDVGRRAELLAAMGTLPSKLEQETLAAMVAEDERRAAISRRNETMAEIRSVLRRVRDSLGAGIAPDTQFAMCGFDVAGTRARIYIAKEPTDLKVMGTSNGVNTIRFAGNNPNGRVTYQIFRRESQDDRWVIHATTKRQTHSDAPVVPGQYYAYKVRAVASRSVSAFSNTAVIYGKEEAKGS